MKIVPDSRTPRRLPSVRATTITTAIRTFSGRSAGTIEVIAATPAETETATVRV